MRYVTNCYTGKRLLVKCGKCEACQQEKAAYRANRIRNNLKDGYIALFSTLTYANAFVPYLWRHHIDKSGYYSVYRDAMPVLSKDGSLSTRYYSQPRELASIKLDFDEYFGLLGTPDLVGYYGRIGVIFYKDFKDFFKRLRINLLRHYGISYKLQYFICCEYGTSTFRPHAHTIIYCRQSDEYAFRSAIIESWQYDYCSPKRMRTEVARNAASYCSSYVNCGASFPSFLKTHGIKPTHSYSKNFGVGLECFSLVSILQKTASRTLYYSRETTKDGIRCISSVLIPKYVINRYFPLFKGYCRLVPSEVYELLRLPSYYRSHLYYRTNNDFVYKGVRYIVSGVSNCRPSLDYNDVDWHEFITRLSHAYFDYYQITGKSRFDYAIDFCEVWNCYISTLMVECYKLPSGEFRTDFTDFYENITEFVNGVVRSDSLSLDGGYVYDPNKRSDILSKTANLNLQYFRMDKSKKLSHKALSFNGFNV